MIISYIGKRYFKCQICTKMAKEEYLATPSLSQLVDWKELKVCEKCAKREVGSRNKKQWEKIHCKKIKS